ncbi:MAG: DsbA family protein [Alphaproteobacteria bacterium]|nr:DsbA family protein [Alphaproteobacteria bacterium]
MRLASAAALAALACSALSLAGCQKSDDAAFGQRVHAYLMAHPEVIEEAAQKLQANQQAAAAKAATDAIQKYRNELERDPSDIVINPNGKVTVVEFFDYRCAYCKLAAPEVVKLIKDNPDIRFVFKEFPIFGDLSDTAAKVALTPQAKPKALQLYQSWMAEKALDDTLLDKDLAAAGLNPAEVRKAADDPAIERQILDTRALASALKIDGTPAFIVGDTLIPGADLPALRAAIAAAQNGGLKTLG